MVRLAKQIRKDKLELVAAGVTFYTILALAPALMALVAVYGLVATPSDVTELVEPMFALLPAASARIIVDDLLTNAVESAPQSLTWRAVLALLLSLWSANRGVKAMMLAVGVAYNETERHAWWREVVRGLAFLSVAVLVVALAVVLLVALPPLIDGSQIGAGVASLLVMLRLPVLFLGALFGLSALYRWGPARRPAQWRWVSLGAVVATVLGLLLSGLIALYFDVVGFEPTGHESLDAVVAVLLWIYASTWAALLGAELNAEIEHQTVVDSTVGEDRSLGERGAEVADHIGAARGSSSRSAS